MPAPPDGRSVSVVAGLLVLAGAFLAAIASGEAPPTPSPPPATPTVAATPAPPPPGWRPPPVPTRRGRPAPKELRLGGEEPTPPPASRSLGGITTLKKPSGGQVAITDDTVGMVLPPVTPATPEEYATMVLAVLQDWSGHEDEARRLLSQARTQHSLTEAEGWVQDLANTASALAGDSARLAAIVPPMEYRSIHSEMVATLRTFDRAIAALAKDPASPVALEAAQELVLDAQHRAMAFYERMRTLAALTGGGG